MPCKSEPRSKCYYVVVCLYTKCSWKNQFQIATLNVVVYISIGTNLSASKQPTVYYYPSWFCGWIGLSGAVLTPILSCSCYLMVTRTGASMNSDLSAGMDVALGSHTLPAIGWEAGRGCQLGLPMGLDHFSSLRKCPKTVCFQGFQQFEAYWVLSSKIPECGFCPILLVSQITCG